MEFAIRPRWDLPVPEAIRLQRELAALVRLEDVPGEPRLIAGVDLAPCRSGGAARAAVVVWDREREAVVESVQVETVVTFPYVPGLLAFREGPAVEEALRRVRSDADLVMVDGQGIAHPRGLGIAAHLGVLLDRPAIGVAKSRLYGAAEEPGPEPGDRAPLLAPDGRRIGMVLRSRRGSKPIYVSPGHLISVERAADLVVACLRGRRLPEPVRLADRVSRGLPAD